MLKLHCRIVCKTRNYNAETSLLESKYNILNDNIEIWTMYSMLDILQEAPQAARVKVLASGNAIERRFR